MTTFVLVHSPMTGPDAWGRVAEELRTRGHQADTPALPGAVSAPRPIWSAQAAAIAEAVETLDSGASPLLVGHSGSGPLLPCIRQLDGNAAGYVFVDAALPRANTSRLETLPAELQDALLGMVQDGLIPPWSSWWGPEAMAHLIEDPSLRDEFVAGCSPTPLEWFTEPLPVFEGWPDAPCGYLRLSEAYIPEAREARERGWACRELEGRHLDILTRPAEVTDELVALASEMGIEGRSGS